MNKKITFAVMILGCCLGFVFADSMRIGTKTQKGTFAGYKNGSIMFQDENGEQFPQPRGSVKSLTIDSPCEASFKASSKDLTGMFTLVKYESGIFTVKDKGKQKEIPAIKVSEITVKQSVSASGDRVGDAPVSIRDIDISGIEGRTDLTQQQTEILNKYKAARSKYNAFVSENSSMVQQMDKAKGQKREELLNELRVRKAQEQPIRLEYETCRTSLVNAFKNLAGNTGTKGTGKTSPQDIIYKVPKLEENQQLIIDTGVFDEIGKLSKAQSEAIQQYNTVKKEYEQYAAAPDAGGDQAKSEALISKLNTAQGKLLSEFPQLKIVQEGSGQ